MECEYELIHASPSDEFEAWMAAAKAYRCASDADAQTALDALADATGVLVRMERMNACI